MKSIIAVVAVAVALSAFPSDALASCPNISGPYSVGGFPPWYEYDFPASCAGISGSVVTPVGTDGCGDTAYQFTGSGSTTYSYTIGANDPYYNSAKWEVDQWVEFTDPNNSQYNTLTITVSVTHNGSTTSYTVLSHNGTQGSVSCWGRTAYWYFSASPGDTITVTASATVFNSNTTVKVSPPFLFNSL